MIAKEYYWNNGADNCFACLKRMHLSDESAIQIRYTRPFNPPINGGVYKTYSIYMHEECWLSVARADFEFEK